jgi:autotransporter-associated beta strand protein
MTVASGANLNLNGQSVLVGSLAGAGNVQNANAANATFGLGADDTNAIFTGTVSDGAGGGRLSLIKTGNGVQTLSGLNNYTGATIVSNGTLQAGLTQTSSLNVSSTGTLEFKDNIGVVLNLSATPGALQLAGGAHLGFELGSLVNYDRINVLAGGSVIVNGTIVLDFFNLSGFGAGTYNLISATSGLNAANYVLGGAPVGFNYTINKTDSVVQLIVAALTSRYWRGDQGTSWATNNAGNTNWSNSADGLTEAGAIPAPGDAVIFSATSAPFTSGSTIATTLDAAFTIDSLQFIGAPAGVTAVTINAGTGGSLTLTPSSSANGISVSATAGAITISAPLTLGAAQTWNIDGGGSLTISGNINMANALTKVGAGSLTLSGTNTGSGGLTLLAGVLNLDSATALGAGTFVIGQGTTINNTSAGAVILSTNNVQTWDGSFTFTGTQSLNLGTGAVSLTQNLVVTTTAGTLTVGGVIGDGASDFSLTKSGAGTLALNGNNTFSGAYIFNGGTTILGHKNGLGLSPFEVASASILQAGVDLSGAGAGPVTNNGVLNADLTVSGANALQLAGNLSGSGNLNKSGAGTFTISGVNSYTGATVLDGGSTVIATNQNMAAATNTLVFGAANTSTNVSSLTLNTASATFAGVMSVQTNTASANTIAIGAGQSLNINNNVTIGSGLDTGSTVSITNLNVTGAGTFNVTNLASAAEFRVGGYAGATANRGNRTVADFSGLASMNISLNTTNGIVRVNNVSSANTSNAFSTLILANNSTLTAATLAVGDSSQFNSVNSQVNALKLGSGINTLNFNTVNIGTGLRDHGAITFNGASGSVVIRNAAGNGRAAFNLGAIGGAGTATVNTVGNTFDVTGHNADLLLGVVNIGTQNRGHNLVNTFSFNQGILDMTSLAVSVRSANPTSGAAPNFITNSTVNLGGGTVNIVNGIVDLARTSGTLTATTAVSATLNLTGGNITMGVTGGNSVSMASAVAGTTATAVINISGAANVTMNGNIVKAGGAGTTSATVNLTGGSLDMTGDAIGSAANTITFSAEQGTLKNLGEFNGGAALVKITAGMLTMEGTSAYTGGTHVNDGAFHLNNASLTGTGTVTVNKTATLANASVLSGTGTVAGAVVVGSTTSGDAGILKPGGNAGAGNGTLTISNAAGLDVKTGSQIQLSISTRTLNSSGFATASGGGTSALAYLTSNPGEATVWNNAPASATDHDYINLTGALSTLSVGDRASGSFGDGSILVSQGVGFTANVGDIFNLLDWLSMANIAGGFDTGVFNIYDGSGNVVAGDLDLPTLGAGLSWDVSAFSKYGVLAVAGVVPEPGRAVLLLLGLASLIMRRRRSAR